MFVSQKFGNLWDTESKQWNFYVMTSFPFRVSQFSSGQEPVASVLKRPLGRCKMAQFINTLFYHGWMVARPTRVRG